MRNLRITNIIQSQAGVRWRRVGGLLATAAAASLLSVKLLLAVYAMAGDLDPSFGTGGKIDGTLNIIGFYPLAIQADGKLLNLDWFGNGLRVSRFKLDGSLDPTFGVDGQREVNFGDAIPANLAIQQDGRIVIAGRKGLASDSKVVVARLRTNGSLDPTFSTDGMVEIPHIESLRANCMALQADGKIVIAGTVIDQGTYHTIYSLLIRLNQDGTLDSSFANSGILTTTIWSSQPNSAEGFNALVIQDDGKIVVSSHGQYAFSRLVRFYANGERDFTFGNNGVFDSAQYEIAQALALQPDGKIVFVTDGGAAPNYSGVLARLSADGILDNTFGQGGKTSADPVASWYAVGLQADGRLVVAGRRRITSDSHSFHLARYQSDGSLDTSFGSNGTVTTSFSKPLSTATALALYGDGRIGAAGHTNTLGSTNQPVIARFLGDDSAPADVRVSSATISPRTVYPGNFVTYTIPVTNYGPGKAAHLTLTAKTPANTVFISFSAPPGWVVYQQPDTGGTGDVSCSAYELPAGSTVNFTLTVRVSPIVPSGTQINQVSSIKSFMPDPNIFNNTWTKTFTVQ